MTGRNSLHYCYDASYQCWFASEEARFYGNNFNSSNGVVCSHLILAYTVLTGTKWLVFFFFLSLLRNVVLWLKRTSTKKLAKRISYQIWYKGCLKGIFGKGFQIWKGGPYPLADLNQEVQIRSDTGIPGEKSGLKYPKPLQSLLSMNQVNLFKS